MRARLGALLLAANSAHAASLSQGGPRMGCAQTSRSRLRAFSVAGDGNTLGLAFLAGYCLMSNHLHLIVTPSDVDGLAVSMKHTHGRYASLERSPQLKWSCPASSILLVPVARFGIDEITQRTETTAMGNYFVGRASPRCGEVVTCGATYCHEMRPRGERLPSGAAGREKSMHLVREKRDKQPPAALSSGKRLSDKRDKPPSSGYSCR